MERIRKQFWVQCGHYTLYLSQKKGIKYETIVCNASSFVWMMLGGGRRQRLLLLASHVGAAGEGSEGAPAHAQGAPAHAHQQHNDDRG